MIQKKLLSMLVLFLLSARVITGAEFIPLGFSASTDVYNKTMAIAEDGALVVGMDSSSAPRSLIRWVPSTGIETIPLDISCCLSMSGDTARIVTTIAWKAII